MPQGQGSTGWESVSFGCSCLVRFSLGPLVSPWDFGCNRAICLRDGLDGHRPKRRAKGITWKMYVR